MVNQEKQYRRVLELQGNGTYRIAYREPGEYGEQISPNMTADEVRQHCRDVLKMRNEDIETAIRDANHEQEETVIAILTNPKRNKMRDRYDAPDVEQFLPGWGTIKVREIIENLEKQGRIHSSQVVHHGSQFQEPEWFWKRESD